MKSLPWFALYVKPKHEKSVTSMLQGKGYDAFLPTYSHRVKNNKIFELPLFPGYVFCRLDLANRLPVMKTPGFLFIVGAGGAPQAICEHEVEGIRRMLTAEFKPIPWPYAPGQEIALDSGPLRGVQGVIVDVSNEKWLVVSVNLLRRSVAVKLQRESLSVRLPALNSGVERDSVVLAGTSHA